MTSGEPSSGGTAMRGSWSPMIRPVPPSIRTWTATVRSISAGSRPTATADSSTIARNRDTPSGRLPVSAYQAFHAVTYGSVAASIRGPLEPMRIGGPPARAGGPPILIGSSGPRMLAATLPYVTAWNAWYADTGNRPEGVSRLRAIVDESAVAVGRDPAEIERTVAVQVRMEGGTGRIMGDQDRRMAVPPLEGSPEVMADALRAYAREGIGHVQLVVDPITDCLLYT